MAADVMCSSLYFWTSAQPVDHSILVDGLRPWVGMSGAFSTVCIFFPFTCFPLNFKDMEYFFTCSMLMRFTCSLAPQTLECRFHLISAFVMSKKVLQLNSNKTEIVLHEAKPQQRTKCNQAFNILEKNMI